jgi:putative phage-type endonuclease
MDRKKGIGGTDISAIVGMNPWKTPLDVWLDKTGQAEDTPDNENLWWGREMEPVLAKRYEKETGVKVYIPPVDVLPYRLTMPPWYLGSPDGLINCNEIEMVTPVAEGGVDFKTSGRPQEWGEPGTDDIPQQYIIQAEWYMGLTGAQWWDVAVLLMGFTRKFAIYRVHRDDELIGDLTEAGEKFWKDHVLTGVAPALDGSKSATEYLKRKYPSNLGPMLEPTDAEILATIQSYQYARNNLKHLEREVDGYENILKALVGDFSGLQGPWGSITWKKSKDSEIVDWKSLATSYSDYQTKINKYTTIRPGSRRWLPKFKKEDV